jgi:hypothetical protein
MAITVTEVNRIRDFEYSTEEPNGKEVYDVFFTTDTLDEYEDYYTKLAMALVAVDPSTALAIPQFAQQLGKTGAFFATYVRNILPKLHKAQNNWFRITIDYRAPDSAEEPEEILDDDPENTPPVYIWGNSNIKLAIYIDKTTVADGGPLPIVNSAGEGFTVLPKVDSAILTLQVNRRTSAGAYSPLTAKGVLNKINADAMILDGFSFDPETVRLIAWRSTKKTATVQKEGQPSFQTTFNDEQRVYHIKNDGWLGEVFDQGLKQFFESGSGSPTGNPGLFTMTVFGEKVRAPQALDGDGLRIFGEKGAVINTPVDRPIGGGKPGVKALAIPGGATIAMLLFNFYEVADINIGDA